MLTARIDRLQNLNTTTTMSCGYHQCLAVYVAVFLGISMLLTHVACVINVHSPLIVRVGKDAVFRWNATNGIHKTMWGLKASNMDNINVGKRIIFTSLKIPQKIYSGIATTALKGRVSFVGNLTARHAWFKITNVSVSDSNTYGANIQEMGQKASTFSSVNLQVTVSPQFTPTPPSSTTIKEGDNLSIQCSAKGPPTPQVKWLHNGNILSQGQGSATLNIVNITRSQSGIYECQASNNPNEEPAKTTTHLTVYYKARINQASSTDKIRSWKRRTITLQCVVASGLPSPNFTWYKPNGDVIPCNRCSRTVSSQVTVQTGQDSGDYGLYSCIATNVVGSDQHYINVTQLFPPGPPNITITDIQSSSLLMRLTKPVYDGGSPVIQYKLIIDLKTYDIDAPKTHQYYKSIGSHTNNTKYEVKLYAKNVAGYGSAFSKVFTARKQGPPSLPEVTVNIQQTSVRLLWLKPDQNGGEITKYTIYKKIIGMDFSWSVVVDVTATSYTVEDLDPGTKYSFIVTASNQYGESPKRNSKAKTVDLPETTTATTTTVVASTVVGVLATFLAVSVLVIVLLVLYIWRITRQTTSNQGKRYDFTHENAVKMVKSSPSSAATLHVPPVNQPDEEYESVLLGVQPQYEIPHSSGEYEIPDNTPTSEDTSHYQQLNPRTKTSQQDDTKGLYENLF